MNKNKFITFIFIVLFFNIAFIFAAENISDKIIREQTQEKIKLERERQLQEKQQIKQKTIVDVKPKPSKQITKSKNCIKIKKINTSQFDLVKGSLIEHIKRNYENKCLYNTDMAKFIDKLVRLHQTQGFVTTKIGLKLPQQKLKQGILEVGLQKGFLNEIDINTKAPNKSFIKAILFNDLLNKPLNINKLGQRIDSINRLSSHQAQIKIKPSSKPYYSDLEVIDNKKDYQKFYVSFDNSGSKATGINKVTIDAQIDDFILPLSKWSLNFSTPMDTDRDLNDSNSYNLSISLPYQNYLLSYQATKSDYMTNQVLTTGDIFYSFGKTHTNKFTITRYIDKTKYYKNSLKLALDLRDEKNYSRVRDVTTFNKIGSRKLAVISLSYEHTVNFKNKQVLFLNPTLRQGIKGFDALDDADFDLEQKAQFSLFKFYGYLSTPFTIKDKNLTWQIEWDAQISEDSLFGAEVFSIGGESSVRGFKKDSLSSESGFYIKNDLTININQLVPKSYNLNANLLLSTFVDYGRIYNTAKNYKELSGIGSKISYQHKNLELSLAMAKNTQRDEITEKHAIYFDIKYKF